MGTRYVVTDLNQPMLDYAALNALAAVVREGSFERAARALHVTPSAVSQRLQQIERGLDVHLLDRSSRTLR